MKMIKYFKSSIQNGQHKQLAKREPLNESLDENIRKIKKDLGSSDDIIIREIRIGNEGSIKIAVLYTDGLADKKVITDFILDTLMLDTNTESIKQLHEDDKRLDGLKSLALKIGDNKEIADFETVYASLLSGDTIILLDGYPQGIAASTQGWKDRAMF
ncbi:spore germination protein [Paenibacillus sp. Soil522]|uniref:spore germination protein n=1 Tax=Paenibacillus sp. Soil522 TaxID=1736388 RepID=UPI0006F6D02D|nr:spore germination protein [Paenibacillus sp. Soil522]KRE38724.1 hypothetical protein ASG81_19535 [Paenibacillus sp. Soil522]